MYTNDKLFVRLQIGRASAYIQEGIHFKTTSRFFQTFNDFTNQTFYIKKSNELSFKIIFVFFKKKKKTYDLFKKQKTNKKPNDNDGVENTSNLFTIFSVQIIIHKITS